MPKINFILPDGSTRTVDATEGWSLMEVARNEGVPGIVAECGGSALCSTCHIHVEPQWREIVGPPADLELMTLDLAPETSEASRLSCQMIVKPEYDGLTVRVPANQAGY
jgi:2Fe-2S ferredoxin